MSARRLVDLLAAILGLVALAPAMLAIAIVQRIVAGKPILFVQRRAAYGGRSFQLVKFRTMREARDAGGALLPDERRMTGLGRALRRTRLDELPQLWNVLVGDMSLIGPRPLLPETIRGAGEAGRRRGRVPPGLTGWAQVNGNTHLSLEEKLALDNWYIDHRGLRLDLQIVARTLLVAIGGERRSRAAIGRAYAGDPRRRG